MNDMIPATFTCALHREMPEILIEWWTLQGMGAQAGTKQALQDRCARHLGRPTE